MHLHKWTPWQDVQTVAAAVLQERRCTKCNKAKRRIENPAPLLDDDDWEMPQ